MSNTLLQPDPPCQSEVLQPHPELPAYYGQVRGGKGKFLRDIFDSTAADYDRLERVLALGSGSWHRREALRRAGLTAGMQMVDVATGTGLVAREALAIVGRTGRVVGVDPSIGMLRQARQKLPELVGVLGRGEALPLQDRQFDFLCMGYALRHLTDLRVAFSEYRRVLRPGGAVCILEISRPAGAWSRRVMDVYFRMCLPIISRLVASNAQTHKLWEYYWETIDQCVPPARVMDALTAAGFERVERKVSLGIFSEFTARVPAAGE